MMSRIKYINKLSLFFVVLILPFFCWQYSQLRETSVQFLDRQGQKQVLLLPAKDRQRLLSFMRLLFAEDSFAYGLLGSKPVSWVCYLNPFPFVSISRFQESFTEYHRTLRIGWKVWSKYRHLFPGTRLWVENSPHHPGVLSIFIANEDQLNVVVKNNKRDFQDILHREVADGSQLLTEADYGSLIDDVLQNHQALIGIVLGYGRENSWAFLRGVEKKIPIGDVWDDKNEHIPGEIRIRPGTTTVEECLAMESCPSFAGNPHSEESMALKMDYLLTRQKVIDYYHGKDFLEATLSLLTGFRPADTAGCNRQ